MVVESLWIFAEASELRFVYILGYVKGSMKKKRYCDGKHC
jgi:hypothetical protein